MGTTNSTAAAAKSNLTHAKKMAAVDQAKGAKALKAAKTAEGAAKHNRRDTSTDDVTSSGAKREPRNTCCFFHSRTGCSNWAMQNCVCAADRFCCDVGWDRHCVGLVKDKCRHIGTCPPAPKPVRPIEQAGAPPVQGEHQPKTNEETVQQVLAQRYPVESRVNDYLKTVWNSSKFEHTEEARKRLSDTEDAAEAARTESDDAERAVVRKVNEILAIPDYHVAACYPHCHEASWYAPPGSLHLDHPLQSTVGRIFDKEHDVDQLMDDGMSDPIVRRATAMLATLRREKAAMASKRPDGLPDSMRSRRLPTAGDNIVANSSSHVLMIAKGEDIVANLTKYEEKRAAEAKLMEEALNKTANRKRIRVACLGDGTTMGMCGDTTGGYTNVLQNVLGTDGYDVMKFAEGDMTLSSRGVCVSPVNPAQQQGGNCSVRNSASLSLLKLLKPQVVTIMLGTNDAKPENWVDAKTFKAELSALVNNITASIVPAPRVILITPPPIYPGDRGNRNASVVNQPGGIADAVVQVSSSLRVPIVDAFQSLGGVRLRRAHITCDGVHPTDEGHRLVATLLSAAVMEAASTVN